MEHYRLMRDPSKPDERGRITLDPDFRRRFPGGFIQILTPDGIHLHAVTGRKELQGKWPAAKEVRRIATKAAMDEIDEELRAIHGVKSGRKR